MEIGTIYVSVQGSRLTKVGERLVIRNKENKILEDIPFFRIRQIICLGSIEISSSAMVQLLRRNIDVVYTTVSGCFKFRLSNMNNSSVRCRLKQYEKASDSGFRLSIAKSVLYGKLYNSKYWLIKRNRPANRLISESIWRITDCMEMIYTASNHDILLGVEGLAAKAYFEGMKYIFKQELGFTDRNRRPPRDPVNAMLSFGYTLLYNMILTAIEQAGLDPMLSNLHAIQDRRSSLALDLMEEFRCLVIDTVVMRIVNLMRVQPKNFFTDEHTGTRMQAETIALLVSEIQVRLKARLTDPMSQKQYLIKDLFLKQAYQYKAIILGDGDKYRPVISK